ncbi:MAG: hypothetical protein HKK67_09140 [Chlorobiaceae bacterium]|nr:hypothetical protein [Chlorobiaceae bacterium]
MQPSTGQGSRTATLRRLRGLPTAAPCTPPSVKSKPEATAKADYRLRSTNPIPAHQPKSALNYKSALVFRKKHHQPEPQPTRKLRAVHHSRTAKSGRAFAPC